MIEEISMKKSRFSEAQIMGILKQAESGVPVSELCREHGHEQCQLLQMAGQVWRHGYVDDLRYETLADENRDLKRMYADLVSFPSFADCSHFRTFTVTVV